MSTHLPDFFPVIPARFATAGRGGSHVRGTPPCADYANLTTLSADFPIGYTAWCFFHQENWYTADRCLGAPGGSYRLSMEYVGCANRSTTPWKYACHQANCFSACQSETVGHTEVYIK